MKKHRLLSLDDLYNYYSTKTRSVHFDSAQSNRSIVVQVDGNLVFDKDSDATEGLKPVKLQSCHTKNNINGSAIAEDVMISALPSFSNRPILGYIHEVDGEWQFYGHNMHLDDDEIVYDEIPIGIVPESCNARLEYDAEKDKTYCVVDGYIFEEYSKAAEILEREQECPVSVELSIRELSYDAKNKVLNIESFYFSGVTILGKDDDGNDVRPGMVGSNIKISDFSAKNNSVFAQNKLVATLEKLNETLSKFNINNARKEENGSVFERLLKKYGKTEADITFNVEGLSDDELSALFDEHFADGDPDPEPDPEPTDDPEPDNNDGNGGDDGDGDDDDEGASVEDNDSGEPVIISDDDDPKKKKKNNNSFSKFFELSHDDIRSALYVLLKSFETEDNEWYWISEVFDDYFIYQGYDPKNIYKQGYQKDGDNVSFSGERIHMNIEYLTDSELVALNEMRSNYAKYAEAEKELAQYKAEPQKMEILNADCYSQIAEVKEFVELKKQGNHFDMSVEDVQAKADAILLSYAKGNKIEFSSDSLGAKQTVTRKVVPVSKETANSSRYGGLFSKKED